MSAFLLLNETLLYSSLDLIQFSIIIFTVYPFGIDLKKHLQAVSELARHVCWICSSHQADCSECVPRVVCTAMADTQTFSVVVQNAARVIR